MKNHPDLDYDLPVLIESVKNSLDNRIVIHGGEPLLIPKDDLEAMLSTIHRKTGKTGIQTNGTLIDEDHLRLFMQYNTSVGLSIDGDGDLNAYRSGIDETARLLDLMKEMRARHINVGVIIVISQANANDNDKLERLKGFVTRLTSMRIHGRINPCLLNSGCSLTTDRLSGVYSDLTRWMILNGIRGWSPFHEMWEHTVYNNPLSCVFKECDVEYTPSARVLLKDGTETNCMRVSAKGIKDRDPSKQGVRSKQLTSLPQDQGGCMGCQYWERCYGGCPAESEDGKRTEFCDGIKAIYKILDNTRQFTSSGNRPNQPPPNERGRQSMI